MKKENVVIIPAKLSPKPSPKEISAAYILANHFQKDVHFVVRGRLKSADFLIDKEYWELKSPTGNGKRTVQHALQQAIKQSGNIIIDSRYSKMNNSTMQNQLHYYFVRTPKLKKLLMIKKDTKVIEIQR